MSSTQTGFFDSLVAAARENPLAAALIGGGALWLLVGDEKLKSSARTAAGAASSAAETGTSNLRAAASTIQRTVAPPTAPEMDHEGSFGVSENIRGARSAASDAVSGTADKIRDRFDEGVAFARENFGKLGNSLPGDEALTAAKSSLAEALERQPLVLGVVGLAIGAAVASALGPSDIENEYIGGASDDVKADLTRRAGAVSQSLREASDTLVAEASDSGSAALEKIRQAGMDAAGAATAKVNSP